MTMFDEARALYGTMRMCGVTQQELARRLCVSQSYVANKLRLLQYSPAMQDAITEGGLSERHARALLGLQNEAQRTDALRRVLEEHMTVAQTEDLVADLLTIQKERTSGVQARVAGLCAMLRTQLENLRREGIQSAQTVRQEEDGWQILLDIRPTRKEPAAEKLL